MRTCTSVSQRSWIWLRTTSQRKWSPTWSIVLTWQIKWSTKRPKSAPSISKWCKLCSKDTKKSETITARPSMSLDQQGLTERSKKRSFRRCKLWNHETSHQGSKVYRVSLRKSLSARDVFKRNTSRQRTVILDWKKSLFLNSKSDYVFNTLTRTHTHFKCDD